MPLTQQICPLGGSPSSSEGCHNLVSIGRKNFSGAITLGLKIPIYGFGIYLPENGVKSTSTTDLIASSAEGLSVSITPLRDLPLGTVREQFKGVLSRRVDKMGGKPEDQAAVEAFLNAVLVPEKLPASAVSDSSASLRRDAQLTFSRVAGGRLAATADGKLVGFADNVLLQRALFDTYLGSEPVCGKAKSAVDAFLMGGAGPGPGNRRQLVAPTTMSPSLDGHVAAAAPHHESGPGPLSKL